MFILRIYTTIIISSLVMNKLELSIGSEIDNIMEVENFIEQFIEQFQVGPKVYGKISLSVIEAVNNAILSGNKQIAEKKVQITAEKEDGKLSVIVKDEGEGFDYTNIPDPTLPDNVEKIAGRGLYLMKTLSDDLVFEDNGSKVTLIFNL